MHFENSESEREPAYFSYSSTRATINSNGHAFHVHNIIVLNNAAEKFVSRKPRSQNAVRRYTHLANITEISRLSFENFRSKCEPASIFRSGTNVLAR